MKTCDPCARKDALPDHLLCVVYPEPASCVLNTRDRLFCEEAHGGSNYFELRHTILSKKQPVCSVININVLKRKAVRCLAPCT